MPICTRCGAQNPDNTSKCNQCGIGFGFQARAQADVVRARNTQVLRVVIWIAVAVVLAIVGPKGYHMGRAAYLRHHLNSIKERAVSDCNGPVKEGMSPYEVDKINQCLASNADLTEAKKDYADFTKGD